MSKIICFVPQLSKYWKNGWSSEEVWNVNYKHYGVVEDDFWEKIKIFQNLFKNKDESKLTESEKLAVKYISTQILINSAELTEVQLNAVKKLYQKDMDQWKELQKVNFGWSTVSEFMAKKLFSKIYIRCDVYMGEESVQLINFKWFFKVQFLKLKCIWRNYQLKQYYKKHPFKYYENYYPGIAKDRAMMFQSIGKTLAPYLRKTLEEFKEKYTKK